MKPRKHERRQLEKLQRKMEKAGEKFGLDPSFAPQLMPREIPDPKGETDERGAEVPLPV